MTRPNVTCRLLTTRRGAPRFVGSAIPDDLSLTILLDVGGGAAPALTVPYNVTESCLTRSDRSVSL
jgi:hypothetical protein